MPPRPTRGQGLLALYGLTAVVWVSVFEFAPGDIEPYDFTFAALSLVFAGGAAILVVQLDLPVLELGWGIFTYSWFIRLLDELAEASEAFESLVPGTIQLVGLVVILIGFAQTTDELRLNLSERNERLAVLSRVLRHNLSNDLSTIMASLGYFDEHATDEESEETAEMGLQTARGLADLSAKFRRIDDVIERAEEEGTQVRDLATVAETVVEEVSEQYPEATVELESTTETRVEATRGLQAAVSNVVENACEHAGDHPTVTVAVDGDRVRGRVVVQDDGPGIPEHELEPIREGRESALSHGSSVGLWFVLWIVELSGGQLSFSYVDGQRVVLSFPSAARRRLAGALVESVRPRFRPVD